MPHEVQNSLPEQHFELNVLGVPVAFRAAVDPERINAASQWIEAQYEELKNRGRHANREQLLMILMIGIADGMLHAQQDVDQRVRKLLLQIEESEKDARQDGR